MIDGTQQKVKIKTQDYTVNGTMKILGKNFKDIQSVKIGTKRTQSRNDITRLHLYDSISTKRYIRRSG